MNISPQEMAFAERRIEFQKKIVLHQTWICCLNCEHWQKVRKVDGNTGEISETEQCSYYNATPPAEIIVHGCAQHFGDIPF